MKVPSLEIPVEEETDVCFTYSNLLKMQYLIFGIGVIVGFVLGLIIGILV